MSKSIQEQCAERVEERQAIRAMAHSFDRLAAKLRRAEAKVIRGLVVEAENRCVDQAVARLPKTASYELTRQVIREAKS